MSSLSILATKSFTCHSSSMSNILALIFEVQLVQYNVSACLSIKSMFHLAHFAQGKSFTIAFV